MDNELQISKLTELLEYLHKNNTNKDSHILFTPLLNNMLSEICFLKAQVNQLDKNNKKNTSSIEYQDIVKSESISKSARLKYINLAEVLGLDHSIILEYQFKNRNAKFSKCEHDWAIKLMIYHVIINVYNAEDNDERNDDIEENYSAKDDDERNDDFDKEVSSNDNIMMQYNNQNSVKFNIYIL
ncbi:hypothetical protein F8M41_011086 [Gigaspora margarita]|uniref:Uncharacterized protein n=1 Tax=Gigaspora margarita TaxID=4874 RepID=A0A8H3WZM7_GIGMA|nr:hypothetical protein F8M41_011086 [Gigaspora margarita]